MGVEPFSSPGGDVSSEPCSSTQLLYSRPKHHIGSWTSSFFGSGSQRNRTIFLHEVERLSARAAIPASELSVCGLTIWLAAAAGGKVDDEGIGVMVNRYETMKMYSTKGKALVGLHVTILHASISFCFFRG